MGANFLIIIGVLVCLFCLFGSFAIIKENELLIFTVFINLNFFSDLIRWFIIYLYNFKVFFFNVWFSYFKLCNSHLWIYSLWLCKNIWIKKILKIILFFSKFFSISSKALCQILYMSCLTWRWLIKIQMPLWQSMNFNTK